MRLLDIPYGEEEGMSECTPPVRNGSLLQLYYHSMYQNV